MGIPILVKHLYFEKAPGILARQGTEERRNEGYGKLTRWCFLNTSTTCAVFIPSNHIKCDAKWCFFKRGYECCSFIMLLSRSIEKSHLYAKTSMALWRHQIETFSMLLAFCAGNSPMTGVFSAQRPVTQSIDVFFYRRLNKRLSEQSWGAWFEMPSLSFRRHSNEYLRFFQVAITRCRSCIKR